MTTASEAVRLMLTHDYPSSLMSRLDISLVLVWNPMMVKPRWNARITVMREPAQSGEQSVWVSAEAVADDIDSAMIAAVKIFTEKMGTHRWIRKQSRLNGQLRTATP